MSPASLTCDSPNACRRARKSAARPCLGSVVVVVGMAQESTQERSPSTTGFHVIPSHPPAFEIPLVAPAEWERTSREGHGGREQTDRVGLRGRAAAAPPGEATTWLVIAGSESGPFGAERFAVPRLVPSCEWADKAEIDQWHELAMKGEAKPIATDETVTSALAAQPRRAGPPSQPGVDPR